MKVRLRMGALVLLLAPAAWAIDPIVPGDALEGRRIFHTKKCLDCHAIRGSGGTLGPDLGRMGKGRTFFQLAGLFLGHSPKMIGTMQDRGFEWPEISPDEMASLFSYLYYMNYLDQPGDYERGKAAFAEKSCAECHSLGSEGGDIAPELDQLARYMSPVLLAQKMWNKGPEMTRQIRALGMRVPRFEGGEMADILAYIRGTTDQGYFDRVYLPPGDPEIGRRIFTEKQCGRCHGADEVLRTTSRRLANAPDLRSDGLNLSVSDVAGVLWNHASEMKEEMDAAGIPFPRFEGAELAHLLAHLYYLRYFGGTGDPTKGAEVLSSKGCVSCHGSTDIAVDLKELFAGVESPFHFVSTMWNHLPTMKEAAEEGHMLLWPAFRHDEMEDLFTYLLAASEEE